MYLSHLVGFTDNGNRNDCTYEISNGKKLHISRNLEPISDEEDKLPYGIVTKRDLLMNIFEFMSDVSIVSTLLLTSKYMYVGMKSCLTHKTFSGCMICPLRRNYLWEFPGNWTSHNLLHKCDACDTPCCIDCIFLCSAKGCKCQYCFLCLSRYTCCCANYQCMQSRIGYCKSCSLATLSQSCDGPVCEKRYCNHSIPCMSQLSDACKFVLPTGKTCGKRLCPDKNCALFSNCYQCHKNVCSECWGQMMCSLCPSPAGMNRVKNPNFRFKPL